MAVSGTISTTVFDTRRVIDQAFRRCRLPAQSITPEMQDYASDLLYLLLSELANYRTPSWCIERIVLPFYDAQPIITLPVGTVEVLNANYRSLQELTGATSITPTTYTVSFSGGENGSGTVNTVGIKWAADATALTFETSVDGVVWVTAGTQTTSASAGEWTWTDVLPGLPRQYFRITGATAIFATEVYLGTLPQEIPMGVLNRDTYVAQNNKVFTGRPLTYWFQRDRVNPVMNLWPAPNLPAEHAQLIVWRHRHIMDVGTLRQEIEVPQRWLESITASLAARVAAETPQVDMNLIPMLEAKARTALQAAWDGDGDGSPTFLQPSIGVYTK